MGPVLWALGLGVGGQAQAAALMQALFQDHAVLQRDRPIGVWGHAAGGEVVTVSLADSSVTAHADPSGQWSAVLPARGAGGPYVLTARGSSGAQQTANDVLVGDVFLCSGQSNMELPVKRSGNTDAEIRNSANDSIRMLTVTHASSMAPRIEFADPVSWQRAAPATVPEWSATCFYFAREMQRLVHVPMGLVHSSWGGANIRPWISAETLRANGHYESALGVLALYAKDPTAAQEHFGKQWEQWWRGKTGDKPGTEPWEVAPSSSDWSRGSGDVPSGDWKPAPAELGDWRYWGVAQLQDFSGVLWYRTVITLSAAQARTATRLDLGAINQVDETWINGRVLGNTFGYDADRSYDVRQGMLHAGANVLVVNASSDYGSRGMLAGGKPRALYFSDGTSVALHGPWQYRIVPGTVGYPPRSPWEPVGGITTLYNAMIAPLGHFGFKAALWYQGESNTGEPGTYEGLLTGLMADWRRQFGAGLPFLIVQLPNYGPLSSQPAESHWAQLREAQRQAVAKDPHAGLAVTIDIGESDNLHPTNKQDVGMRLARAARHVVYGESIAPSGPVATRALWRNGAVVVDFTDIERQLVAYSHQTPIAFELCGDAPGACQFAAARIEGNTVVLSVPAGDAPTRVRYCWGDSPVCTLFDANGLPAGPFEIVISGTASAPVATVNLGLFEGESDIGTVNPPGTAGYDPSTNTYTLTSAGANTWYRVDNFHYLWKKTAADVALTGDVTFPPKTYSHEPNPHRKGILMFRQSLEAGGAYVGVGVHGSGMTALQFRREPGANTEDVELNIDAPRTVRIEKRGDTFTLYLSMTGEPLHQVGASVTLHLEEPFYVGLGAVSHDVSTTDRVEFANVTIGLPARGVQAERYSTLRTIQVEDQFRRAVVVRSAPTYMQSANWTSDGKTIYFHEDGQIRGIPATGGEPESVPLGGLHDCSGNFGLSPDRKVLAVSCAHDLYVVTDGKPRRLTQGYFHAWSPDSRTIAFTRGSANKADIFTIPAAGGAETRLTSDTINDGPDYSPDGKYLYFDSSRSGSIQIWRMKPDGSESEQVTDDDNTNSSPHVSPDGMRVAFLSQTPSHAALKVFTVSDGLVATLATFEGDRGSFSMYGWGDHNHLAFISYQTLVIPRANRPPITGVAHIAVYAASPGKSERFYVHDLGAVKGVDPENPRGTRYYFSPTQFVEVLPLPGGPASSNRLDHVAFTTTDVEALRQYLQVAQPVTTGSDGSQWFAVNDPEGNRIEFVQPGTRVPDIPANPLSSHIIHVGFIIHDRAREDEFFKTTLGFKPYWFGGMTDDEPTWISQQVPDGTDWLEYMIVRSMNITAADRGVLNHFSLGVPDVAAAYTLLWNGARLDGQANTPKIGRDAKWQLNLLDPDGTRAEIMELHAIGTPCCSPFTASDPQK